MKFLTVFLSIIVILFLASGVYLFSGVPQVAPAPLFFTILVNEMKVSFVSKPSRTMDQETLDGFPTVVNGSYFWQTSTGTYFPAGLWKSEGVVSSKTDFSDPNLSHIVTYTNSGNIVAIEANSDFIEGKCPMGCVAFQAWPLIASDRILVANNGSWHAQGKHERTILGIQDAHTPIIFIFTEKISLTEAGEKILGKYPNVTDLINLDGWPSTAFKTQIASFRWDKILPIVWHIR